LATHSPDWQTKKDIAKTSIRKVGKNYEARITGTDRW
jgi:hypothetical protein